MLRTLGLLTLAVLGGGALAFVIALLIFEVPGDTVGVAVVVGLVLFIGIVRVLARRVLEDADD